MVLVRIKEGVWGVKVYGSRHPMSKGTGDIGMFNLVTPNVNYSCRTAPLTFKFAFYIFIQQI